MKTDSIGDRNWRRLVDDASAVALALGMFTLLLAVELREAILNLVETNLFGADVKNWLFSLLSMTSSLARCVLAVNMLSALICVKWHVMKWLITVIAQIWLIGLAILITWMAASALIPETDQGFYDRIEPGHAELEIRAACGLVIALAILVLDWWVVALCFEVGYPSPKERIVSDNVRD